MKKQYQTPFVTIQKITTCKLICTSITSVAGVDGLGISNEGSDDASITTGNSRRTSVWDDDKEDKY